MSGRRGGKREKNEGNQTGLHVGLNLRYARHILCTRRDERLSKSQLDTVRLVTIFGAFRRRK